MKLRVNITAILLLQTEVTMAKISGFCGALWLTILNFNASQRL